METRVCQNCKNDFVIEADDFSFYEKIDVPAPTFCPECRSVRRMLWRNERSLYRRKCDATGKDIITMFAPEKPYTVYDREYWWSDAWDPKLYGKDIDWSRPFLEQFKELLAVAPLPAVGNTNCIRSDYGNHNADCKDCYLTFASWKNEATHYSLGMIGSNNTLDCYKSTNLERSYFNTLCDTGFKVSFSYMADHSTDSAFLDHVRGMNDCFGCVNMRNKSHCIYNEQFSAEEYKKRLSVIDLGSYSVLEQQKKEFSDFSKTFPKRFANNVKVQDCTGDYILNSKNCKKCFDVYEGCENLRYATHVAMMKDSYEVYGGGVAELIYEGVDSGLDASNYIATVLTHGCHDVKYTYNCFFASHLFACVGIRGSKYCILNKQYTESEYNALVPKIIEHMNAMPYVDAQGREYRFGDFFPEEIAPFAYNETIAMEYFPRTKNEIEERGYVWRAPEERHYEVTISAQDLPDHIRDVPDSITKEVIGCLHAGKCNHICTTAFRIIPDEITYLKEAKIALPRLCPNCRHFERLAKRTPMKLWHRECMCTNTEHGHEGACSNDFETSYSPERPEVIYCEGCYQKEVI